MPNTITVTDQVERATFIVCARLAAGDAPALADNLSGHCCQCHEPIQFRPHVPGHLKKICIQCAAPKMQADAANGKLKIAVTAKTVAEVALALAKPKGNT